MTAIVISTLAALIFCGCRFAGDLSGKERKDTADGQEDVLPAGKEREKSLENIKKPDIPEESGKQEAVRSPVRVEETGFERISRQEIRIFWSDETNPYVREYRIRKRRAGQKEWQTVGRQKSDNEAVGRKLSFTDRLEDSGLQQSEYRVDVTVADEEHYEGKDGISVFASNILVCIDPGHYAGQNVMDDGENSYAEGDFTLELSEELKKILEGTYGVTVSMTRKSGNISIGGYTDGELDGSYISLRGEYSLGSDLFLSLHTNANQEGANGYGTISQPIEIMKPVVIANALARESQYALDVGNAVGTHLADAGCRLGIAIPGKFQKAEGAGDIVSWTDEFNDSLETAGTICYRLGDDGQDYYGVLRGANDVGVPGLIIEHGFHTVPEMRKLAAEGVLQKQWAEADAVGIAEGLALEKLYD